MGSAVLKHRLLMMFQQAPILGHDPTQATTADSVGRGGRRGRQGSGGALDGGGRLLEHDELIDCVCEAQGGRRPHSRTRGRSQTPAEIVLRLLLLKHVRNWRYQTLEREVRLNLAYRDVRGIGLCEASDAKTLARIGQAIDGDVVADCIGGWSSWRRRKEW